MEYDLGKVTRTLSLPEEVEQWSQMTLQAKLVKIGAKLIRHGQCVTFQLAEVDASALSRKSASGYNRPEFPGYLGQIGLEKRVGLGKNMIWWPSVK